MGSNDGIDVGVEKEAHIVNCIRTGIMELPW